MNPALLASNEFGFTTPTFSGDAQSSASEPATALAALEQQQNGKRFWEHPGFVLACVVGVTALGIAEASKPLARARLEGKAGPAEGSVEGSI